MLRHICRSVYIMRTIYKKMAVPRCLRTADVHLTCYNTSEKKGSVLSHIFFTYIIASKARITLFEKKTNELSTRITKANRRRNFLIGIENLFHQRPTLHAHLHKMCVRGLCNSYWTFLFSRCAPIQLLLQA